jgi:hypothetical protein
MGHVPIVVPELVKLGLQSSTSATQEPSAHLMGEYTSQIVAKLLFEVHPTQVKHYTGLPEVDELTDTGLTHSSPTGTHLGVVNGQ